MYESILIDLLARARTEFTKINTDLAATKRDINVQSSMERDMTEAFERYAARQIPQPATEA